MVKNFYLALIIALGVDIVLLPVLGEAAWLPRLTLAIIPFAFLFTPQKPVIVTFIVVTLFYWLTTSLNLGIIVFTLGLTLLFIRQVIPRFFHKEVWQTLVISSLGVIIFGFSLIGLSLLLRPNSISLSPALIVSFLLSAVVAVGTNKILKR